MREPLPLTPITVLHKPAIRCKLLLRVDRLLVKPAPTSLLKIVQDVNFNGLELKLWELIPWRICGENLS